MIFRCTIHRQSTAFGAVAVDADSPDHARELAEQRCRDGLVNLTEGGDQYEIDVDGVEAAE